MPPVEQLPPISAIDAADEKVGLLLSDLDGFRHTVEVLCGDDVPLADHVFMAKAGIATEERPSYIDPALVCRLLVLVDELLSHDLEALRVDAEKIRARLLELYRGEIIEQEGRRRARENA